MLSLLTTLFISIILTVVFLILVDAKTSMNISCLHHQSSTVNMFTKFVFKSDLITNTIKHFKKLGSLSISNICRLSK